MYTSGKSEAELRFELLTWGIVLVTVGIIYITLYDVLPSLILFIPGLILLGAAVFQDMQEGWRAGWMTYVLAIIVVATGLAGIVNDLISGLELNWLVIAVIEFGIVLVAKALYDPTPR